MGSHKLVVWALIALNLVALVAGLWLLYIGLRASNLLVSVIEGALSL